MNEVLEKIQKIGIVPVVVLDDAKDAAPLVRHFARAVFRALRLHSVQQLLKSPSVLWQKSSRRC